MSWLRSAAIYLVITGIFVGAVWLFWGKDLEKLWKKTKEKPIVKEKIPKEIEKKKAELKKLDIPRVDTAIDQAKLLPVNANAEWKKTQSGVEGLVAAQKRENTRDLQVMTGRHDNRMIEILKQVKLYKEPKPAALFPPEPAPAPVKTTEEKSTKKETAKPKKTAEKKNEPLKPMF